MTHRFADLLWTPEVAAAQERYGSRAAAQRMQAHGGPHDRLTEDEADFIRGRDGFFLATVGSSGWPYVQFRGGPPGFVHVLDPQTIAWADVRGNRQYVSVGNLGADDRIALILLDYPTQTRLKVLGRARVADVADDPELAARLDVGDGRVERSIVVTVEAFDWNCPQHITPRFSAEQVEVAVAPLRQRLAELEAEVERLRVRQA